jgi:hypothetical protein
MDHHTGTCEPPEMSGEQSSGLIVEKADTTQVWAKKVGFLPAPMARGRQGQVIPEGLWTHVRFRSIERRELD